MPIEKSLTCMARIRSCRAKSRDRFFVIDADGSDSLSRRAAAGLFRPKDDETLKAIREATA
jgi:hypothetical protein